MLVSVVIPAKNEQDNIGPTLEAITKTFQQNSIRYEIIVVNDGSLDDTEKVVLSYAQNDSGIRIIENFPPFGFGYAIRKGLSSFTGDMVIVSMADSSDDPKDMVRYIEHIKNGYDCCFGSRWGNEAKVEGYPKHKLVLNRIVNAFINILFGLQYNDTTNAFKAYSRKTIEGIQPFLSRHFNITVELPLKAVVRGYSFHVIPTSWYGRKKGKSSLRIQEMGSRYLFIIMYILLEKWLTGKDYKKDQMITKEHKEMVN